MFGREIAAVAENERRPPRQQTARPQIHVRDRAVGEVNDVGAKCEMNVAMLDNLDEATANQLKLAMNIKQAQR